MKLKEKLKKWLFADEFKKIEVLETCYKGQIKWCQERADDVYRASERARLSYQKAEKEVEECRRLITQFVYVGVDVGFHSDDHSWAVICIAGKPEYVKFLPLTGDTARDVLRFLKQFEYSNRVIDSPIAFRRMVDDKFFK